MEGPAGALSYEPASCSPSLYCFPVAFSLFSPAVRDAARHSHQHPSIVRLTQIKLAGFKSFVEPTVIPTPSQLVGVVGPNGCGKSNIIDAVRWVLGNPQVFLNTSSDGRLLVHRQERVQGTGRHPAGCAAQRGRADGRIHGRDPQRVQPERLRAARSAVRVPHLRRGRPGHRAELTGRRGRPGGPGAALPGQPRAGLPAIGRSPAASWLAAR